MSDFKHLVKTVPTSWLLLLLGSGLPGHAAPPAWWTSGGSPAVDAANTSPDKNRGMANVGQAKYMVSEALRTLDTAAPAIATDIRTALNGTGPGSQIVDLTVPSPKTPEWIDKQRAPLTLGQLKALATPFYNRLNTHSATWVKTQIELNHGGSAIAGQHYWQVTGNTHFTNGGYYPWNPATPVADNKLPATIGQLKAVFSLRFENLSGLSGTDSDGDGLPDAWETLYFGGTSGYSGGSDVEPDGARNSTEYSQGTNPLKRDHPAVELSVTRAGVN